ncbi:MAG: hypothetical protein WBA23_05535 [Tunicatimonas sp.]|uniref:hypothetical protein n=1 Tax=Tunicatimonas sp. TaxID=1940096 RepID=UPI003C71DDA3
MKKDRKGSSIEVFNSPNQAYYQQFERSLKNLDMNRCDEKYSSGRKSSPERSVYT